jgi:hypothetical protein
MDRSWRDFYANVATLPIDGSSVFVRGVIRDASGEYSSSPALPLTSRYETKLFSIGSLVNAFDGGMIQRYDDLLTTR